MARPTLIPEPTALQSATLVDALIVLHELEDSIGDLVHADGTEASDARRLGQFEEACNTASDRLFNVLNTGANLCQSQRFDQAMEHYHSRRKDRRAE